MPDIVSRNTIKLVSGASAVDNYYAGYRIIVTRFDAATGKQLVQKKVIKAYEGSTRIATISGIWDADFIPAVGDTYDIVPRYPDSRVSINFAIQTLDYIKSVRYGKGLDPFKDLYLPSWLESARLCDAQSDVTIKTATAFGTLAIGDVYYFNGGGALKWQGRVKSFSAGHIRFTECIGKLANKWNSWKVYPAGTLVYEEDRLYLTTGSGTITTRPVHVTGTSGGLTFQSSVTITKLSGAGPASIALFVAGNPVRDINAKGQTISGYSLYDSDGVDYWRYLGWDAHDQRYVTRHQGNLSIDTSAPISDNLNNMLQHFGGILRYSAGKYHLDVEVSEPAILENDVRNLTLDDIIGKIQVSDEGIRKSFNSLTVAYADPSNKFEGRNISFFNSEFLKADRNVPKKGNVSIPGITNYYNARMLADKFLVKSRYGLTINLNVAPKGLLLLAGSVIQLQHDKYDWVDKKFRIINLAHNENATVDIVAEEYDDKFYLISNIRRISAAAGESTNASPVLPGNLVATKIGDSNAMVGAIELEWSNTVINDPTVYLEIFRSNQPTLTRTVTTIASGKTFTTSTAHGLAINDKITSQTALNGLEYNKTYYIKTAPTSTTFTLSASLDGVEITDFVSGTGLALPIVTASILVTLPSTATSYIDVVSSDSDITRYYWIRYRIE
jgi:hypothetical protein